MITTNHGAPKRNVDIPKSAIWSGSIDGGYWIDLVKIKEDLFQFKIYNDWSGNLMMDADFKFIDNKEILLTKENWKEKICCYSHSLDSNVTLTFKNNEEHHSTYILKSVYPAFGGSDWDVIREKYDLKSK